jgi:hypothetical protein
MASISSAFASRTGSSFWLYPAAVVCAIAFLLLGF